MKSVDEVANAMYEMIAEAAGKKKYKAMDLNKAMRELYGEEIDKEICRKAIKQIIDTGRCVYTYFGGSYIEVPHREGAAND